ncbi:lysyl oxidase family protein [Nocardioides sp.]|uniref:lysyl oxidase family protein n=1 Tax=Nocardioides sp. TaxID=35761 RepID=UPI003527AD87
MRRFRPLAASLAVAALPATVLAVAAPGVLPSAGAAPGVPPITLTAPDTVTVSSYNNWIYDPLGVRVTATDEAFEVWSHRASYDDPITSEWRSGTMSGALPEGSMTTFNELSRFYTLRVRRADGTMATRRTPGACLNDGVTRNGPDSPLVSPYPEGCPYNPYTLGSVMGIQRGWSATLNNWSHPLRLKPGTFTVTAVIAPAYRAALGISLEDARTTFTMVVTPGTGCRPSTVDLRGCRTTAPAAPRPAAARPHAARPAQAQSGAVSGPLMDLRTLPAFGISLNGKGTALRFGATVWNAGDSQLLIDGFRRPGEDVMDAYQYFFDADGNETGYQQVGQMHWHEGNHHHWHFEDFAQYELLNADMSLAVRSTKQSFCLAATDAVDYTVPGADWHPWNTDLSTACGGFEAQSIREVLQAGNGDTYYQFRTGQAFRLGSLPNGIYYIRVTANPEGNLIEGSTDNNTSLRKIRLGGQGKDRRVKVFPVGLVDESLSGFFRPAALRARYAG